MSFRQALRLLMDHGAMISFEMDSARMGPTVMIQILQRRGDGLLRTLYLNLSDELFADPSEGAEAAISRALEEIAEKLLEDSPKEGPRDPPA